MKHSQIIFVFLISPICDAKKYVKEKEKSSKRNLLSRENFTLCINLQTNAFFKRRSIKQNTYFTDTQKCLRHPDVYANHLKKMRIVLNEKLNNMTVIKEILDKYQVRAIDELELIIPANFKASKPQIKLFNKMLNNYHIKRVNPNISIYKSSFEDIKYIEPEIYESYNSSLNSSSSSSSDDNMNESLQTPPLYIGIHQDEDNEFTINTKLPKENNNTIKIEFCFISNPNMLHHVLDELKKEFRQIHNPDKYSIIVDNFECCTNNLSLLKWLLNLDNKEIIFYNPTGIKTCIEYIKDNKKDHQKIYFEVAQDRRNVFLDTCEKYHLSAKLESSSAYHKKYLIEN